MNRKKHPGKKAAIKSGSFALDCQSPSPRGKGGTGSVLGVASEEDGLLQQTIESSPVQLMYFSQRPESLDSTPLFFFFIMHSNAEDNICKIN